MIDKKCSRCQQHLNVALFGKDSSRKDGLASTCKPCRAIVAAERDPAKRKASDERFRRSHPEYYRTYGANWYQANKPRVLARRKERAPELKAYFKQWAKDNPERVAAKRARRRASKLACTVASASAEAVSARIRLYGGCCAYCSNGKFEHLDHAIPLTRGGSSCAANLFPACRDCNLQKGSKKPSEWAGFSGFKIP